MAQTELMNESSKFLVVTSIEESDFERYPEKIENFYASCEKHDIHPHVLNVPIGACRWLLLKQFCAGLQKDYTVFYVDAVSSVFLRPISQLKSYYENQLHTRGLPFFYVASSRESPLQKLSDQLYKNNNKDIDSSEEILDLQGIKITLNAFITSAKIVADLITEEWRNISDPSAKVLQYLYVNDNIELGLDTSKRFIVWPRFRVDIGKNIVIDANHETLYYVNGNKKYAPYLLLRDKESYTGFLSQLGIGKTSLFQSVVKSVRKYIYSG